MVSTPSPMQGIDWIALIRAFAHLFRLPVGILAALAGCATITVLNPTTPFLHYLLTAALLVCMMSAACAINDYWDVEKDRIDHPDRPLPSGCLSLQQAWWGAVSLFSSALLLAIPLGLYPLLLVITSVVLLWNYSHMLAYSGILGNGIVATIIAALIFLGSLVAHRPFSMLYPIWFLFCYALAKEIVWDVHDAEGDRAQGIVTVANRWGDRTAFAIAWGLLGLLLVSIPAVLNWLTMAHPLLFMTFSLALLLSIGTAVARYQQQRSVSAYNQLICWERLSMGFGVLALLASAPPL